MAFFSPENSTKSPIHNRLHAIYEILRTLVDFTAALFFLVGSWLFFYASQEVLAIWLFVIGSGCFLISPTLKLIREIHFWRLGKIEKLAERFDD